jgi:ectoine hydroxylase-related dioxygenase (phytanoyl-CoA dioxygenase family)
MTTAAPFSPIKLAEHVTPVGGFRESNDAFNDVAELRRRMDQDGYLFIRQFQNVAGLMQVRREFLDLCAQHGWLAPGSNRIDGIYSGLRPFPRYPEDHLDLYRTMIRLPAFNGMSITREVIAFFTRFLGGPVLAHAQNIARITFPGHDRGTTQPHQDFWYIKGTPETYTTWTPLGDCPRELGSLAVLEGSHKLGPLPHRDAIGAGGKGVSTAGTTLRWLSSDFQIGDVVLFHSYTVHAGLDNQSPDRLRLSLDFRYQRADHAIGDGAQREHYCWGSDDEIYK